MSSNLDILKEATGFKSLHKKALESLLSLAETRHYAAGEVLFVEMTKGDELYLVLDGTLSVQLALSNADKQYEVISLGRGELVGEINLVEEGLRSGTVTADTDATVLAWKCSALREECEKDPEMGYRLILGVAKVLARRIRRWNASLLDNSLWGMP